MDMILLTYIPFSVPPKISLSPAPKSYNEGTAVNLSCTASGTPDPDVH